VGLGEGKYMGVWRLPALGKGGPADSKWAAGAMQEHAEALAQRDDAKAHIELGGALHMYRQAADAEKR
jgi:hypothetical protein